MPYKVTQFNNFVGQQGGDSYGLFDQEKPSKRPAARPVAATPPKAPAESQMVTRSSEKHGGDGYQMTNEGQTTIENTCRFSTDPEKPQRTEESAPKYPSTKLSSPETPLINAYH